MLVGLRRSLASKHHDQPREDDRDRHDHDGAGTRIPTTRGSRWRWGTLPNGVAAGSPNSVRITILDAGSEPGVTVSATSLTVTEGGTNTYTVKLNSRPGADVTVTPASSAVAKATVSGALTFTPSEWNTPKTVTVTGVEDADAANDRATIRHTASSSDSDYGGRLAIDQVAVTVNDDDTAVSLSATPSQVMEGSPVTVTVRLAAALSSDVKIPVALTADTAETDDYGPLASITISRGKTTGTGTITTAQDTDTDDERFTVALGTLPNGVAAGSPNSVRITILDAGSESGVTVSASSLTVTEGGTNTYTVKLELQTERGRDGHAGQQCRGEGDGIRRAHLHAERMEHAQDRHGDGRRGRRRGERPGHDPAHGEQRRQRLRRPAGNRPGGGHGQRR